MVMNKNSLATRSFTSQLQSIASGIIWKDLSEANKYESFEESESVDYYMAACSGMIDFESIRQFSFQDLSDGLGLSDELILKYMEDKNNIPESYRTPLINKYRKRIIDNYEEKNEYYRMLNGLPPNEDIKRGVVFYNTKYEDIPKNIPIHELGESDKRKLEVLGYFDELYKKYPDKKYLKHLCSRKIKPYHARSAGKFDILLIDTTVTGNILEDFKDEYRKCTDYMIRVHYTDGFRKNNEMYDKFMAMAILFMTIQQMNKKYLETDITRDFYDLESIKTVYDSYGVPFYEEVPLNYHKKIIRKINKIIGYKGSHQVLFDLCDLFDNTAMDFYGYYLVKSHRQDEDGNPLFIRKPDGTYDNEAMYSVSFVQVPIGEDAYIHISEETNHIEYQEMVQKDNYWLTDSDLIEKMYTSEYNYIQTKYLGIRLYFDLMNIMYEEAYFFRMLFDNRKIMEKLTVTHGHINSEVSLFDLAIYIAALFCKKNNFSGNIVEKPEQVARVLGFSFKENLKGVINDISNNPLIDDSISKLLIEMDINDISDVRRVFENIQEIINLINNKIYTCKDKETFYAYKNLRKILLTTKMTNETYQLSDGNVAGSFGELLSEISPLLYDRFQNDEINVSVEIDYVISLLLKIADNLKYLDLINDLTLESVTTYLFKMIEFFKSAKAQLTDFNIIYTINSRSSELIKLFADDAHSESHDFNMNSILDLVYSDLIDRVITTTNINSPLLIKDLCVLIASGFSIKDIIGLLDDKLKWSQIRRKYDIIYLFDVLTDVSDPVVFKDIITLIFETYKVYHLWNIPREEIYLYIEKLKSQTVDFQKTILELVDVVDRVIYTNETIREAAFNDSYLIDKYSYNNNKRFKSINDIYDVVRANLLNDINDVVSLYDYFKVIDDFDRKTYKENIYLFLEECKLFEKWNINENIFIIDKLKRHLYEDKVKDELFSLYDFIELTIKTNPIVIDTAFNDSYLIDKYSVVNTVNINKQIIEVSDRVLSLLKQNHRDTTLLSDLIEIITNISIKRLPVLLPLVIEEIKYIYINKLNTNHLMYDSIKQKGIGYPYYKSRIELYDDIQIIIESKRLSNNKGLLADKLLLISTTE